MSIKSKPMRVSLRKDKLTILGRNHLLWASLGIENGQPERLSKINSWIKRNADHFSILEAKYIILTISLNHTYYRNVTTKTKISTIQLSEVNSCVQHSEILQTFT